jgi:hypothetical protein
VGRDASLDGFREVLPQVEPVGDLDGLLVLDPGVTATIRDRQLGYLSQSTIVEAETVKDWPFHVRLVDNVIGMASPRALTGAQPGQRRDGDVAGGGTTPL